MNILDEQIVYRLSDEEILGELRHRICKMRQSCCFSQQRLSELSGVSIASIKRLESNKSHDISLVTLIRILRTMTQLEGINGLVPIVPNSPFLDKKEGKPIRISSKMSRI